MEKAIVDTRSGTVRGVDLGPVLVWKGVPYAAPSVGARRFQPPQPPEPWAGIRDATTFGPIAPQLPFRMANDSWEVAMPEPQSEDCLYLNIWAPRPDGQQRPVMVWVHGGALLNGAGYCHQARASPLLSPVLERGGEKRPLMLQDAYLLTSASGSRDLARILTV